MSAPQWRRWLERYGDKPWQQYVPPGLALLPAIVLSIPLLKGRTPLSYDHATHLFKGWHFWEEMLGRGRLRGWSHYWAFGTPSDELVPFGGEAWLCLFRMLTLGQGSWLTTYRIAFVGFLLFLTWTTYRFTRGLLGTRAAVVCAWLAILDPGGMLEGGWTWHTYWGVWPVSLAMSFGLLSLVRLDRVLSHGHSRDVLWAGLWLGASLLTHQMALLVFAVAAPLLCLDHLCRSRDISLERVGRAAGALAFGFALSAFFLLPFMTRTGTTQDLGWLGDSLPVVSQRLMEGHVFLNMWPPVQALGLLGAWFILRDRARGGIFLAACTGVFVLIGSGTIIRDLHLERVMPTLIKIESNRMLLVAKLFGFPLVAYAAVRLIAPAAPLQPHAKNSNRVARFGFLALVLALLLPGARHFYDTQISKTLISENGRKFFRDFQPLLTWTQQQRKESGEHYRIAYHMWRGEHLPTLAPAFDDTLMYKIGYTPTQIFNKMPMTDETELLRALSVKYIVSSYPLKRADVQFERAFGSLRVYRFKKFTNQPFSLTGPGTAELLEFSPERIRLQLQDTGPSSRLKLHVAHFDRWQATQEGANGSSLELPVDVVPVFGAEYPMLMEVPASDGELSFDYVYRAQDWVGLLFTLLAAPAFGGVVWSSRRSKFWPRVFQAIAERSRPLIGAAVLASALGALWAGWSHTSRIKMLPLDSIFQQLDSHATLTFNGAPCVKRAPLSYSCGKTHLAVRPVPGAWGVHLCMNSPTAGEFRLKTPLSAQRFLSASYDPAKKGKGNLELLVSGQSLGRVKTRPAHLRHQRVQFDTRPYQGQVVDLEVVVSGAAVHCFDVQVVGESS